MRLTEPATEHEMIAAFLRAEVASPRFGRNIRDAIARDGRDREIVERPDVGDNSESAYRRELLGETRGYGRSIADTVFTGFPHDVVWQRAVLERDELAALRYIAYDYWIELSGGTRRVGDGAASIKRGVMIFRVPNDGFWAVADAIRDGATFPEPILVGTDERSPLVILEGHVRLTAYLLRPAHLPPALPVIVGYSPQMGRWPLY